MSGLLILAGIEDRGASLPFPVQEVRTPGGDRVALAQSTTIFPLDRPVADGDAVHALRGYALGDGVVPADPARATALVIATGRALATDPTTALAELSGVCTVVSATPDAVHVATDASGLHPVYVWSRPGQVGVSSHERVLARAVGAPMDPVGVVQTVAHGYALGARTLHQGITQVPAGAAARIDRPSGRITVTDHPHLYGPVRAGQTLDGEADTAWDLYQAGLRGTLVHASTAGILMSGGFDTRLVALGLAGHGRSLVALTIGDAGNHEVGVARRVAELTGADWKRRTPVTDLDKLESAAADMAAAAESLCFPTCWFGGIELADRGAATLSTGYGGETLLGGQGTGPFLGAPDRLHRLLDVARRGTRHAASGRAPVGLADLVPVLDAMVAHHRKPLERLRDRVGPDLRSAVDDAVAGLHDELETELTRYLAVGPTALEQVAERFWYEHHVRKHFGRQELTLDAVRPVLLPTLATPMVVHLSTMEPDLKVDHRTYLRVVRRHFGSYARIPTSNVPFPLNWPSPLLWAGRAGRAVWDDRQTAMQQRTHGAKGKRFGWSNYEAWVRRSTLFDQLPRLVAPWLIDPTWLAGKLDRQASWQERVYSSQEELLMATVSALVSP